MLNINPYQNCGSVCSIHSWSFSQSTSRQGCDDVHGATQHHVHFGISLSNDDGGTCRSLLGRLRTSQKTLWTVHRSNGRISGYSKWHLPSISCKILQVFDVFQRWHTSLVYRFSKQSQRGTDALKDVRAQLHYNLPPDVVLCLGLPGLTVT